MVAPMHAYTPSEIAHVLLALACLLLAAHGMGFVFSHFRQPRVIGEICGGLLLGPTVMGALLPIDITRRLFPPWGPTPQVLGVIYQLGLLLLMFCSGAEIRGSSRGGETRSIAWIAALGTCLPFLLGMGFLGMVDVEPYLGTAQNETAFLLIFAAAIAVTSIPVISRIFMDLGVLETPFARVVLGAAVIEDILLYVVIAVAVSFVREERGDSLGLPQLLGLHGGLPSHLYHTFATLAFFAVAMWLGPRLYRRVLGLRFNLLHRASPIAFQLVFMMLLTGACVFLGIHEMFGAFVAGMAVAAAGEADRVAARESIKSFAFAFFVPVYFAIVGFRLNLHRAFDPWFFLLFFGFACAAKAISVYAGARAAKETHHAAVNFAVAMNARGGPGIVLASTAFDARIISEPFYAVLILLAILTSLLAGSWLERMVRSGRPLR